MPLPLRIFLHLLGAGIGFVAWSMFGLGLMELGIVASFDPLGVGGHPTATNPTPPETEPGIGTTLAHWSILLFVGGFTWQTPNLIGWLTKPPAAQAESPESPPGSHPR